MLGGRPIFNPSALPSVPSQRPPRNPIRAKQECQSPHLGTVAGRPGLGWTTMSERELQRIQVLSEVTNRVRTVASASVVLALSTRQVHRLLKAYRSGGAGSLAHKARGRPSNNRIQEDVRNQAMALVRARYPDLVRRWGARCWPCAMSCKFRARRCVAG